MSKSKVSRDEMRRRIGMGGEGVAGREEDPLPNPLPEGEGTGPVKVTTWAGWANYECQLCAYATLDAEGMAGHLKAVHGWREGPLPNPLPKGEGTRGEDTAAVVVDEEQSDQDEVM